MSLELLNTAGIPNWPARCPDPPAGTYGLYFDDVSTELGPDPVAGAPRLLRHDVMVELYEAVQDPATEAAFEAVLDAAGVHYEKQARYWLQNTQRYQVIYEFSYIEKRRA